MFVPSSYLMSVVIIVALVCTVSVPRLTLSEHEPMNTVEIEAQGFYAEKYVISGYGTVDITCALMSAGSIYILLLDEKAYTELLSDDIDIMFSPADDTLLALKLYRMDHEQASYSGFMFTVYVVAVNHLSAEPAVAYLEVDKEVTLSLAFTVAMIGVTATCGGALMMFRMPKELQMMEHQSRSNRLQTTFIVKTVGWCILITVAGVIWIFARIPYPGKETPYSLQMDLFGFHVFDWYIEILFVTIAAAYLARFRLTTVGDCPETALSSLAHRLRISRCLVTTRPRMLRVRGLSSMSELKVRAYGIRGGSVIVVQGGPSPMGWGVLAFLVGMSYSFVLAYIALATTVFILYDSHRFARTGLLPRMASRTVATDQLTPRERTFLLMVDSLADAYRIATEAHEAALSKYHDRLLISMIAAVAIWGASIAVSSYFSRDLGVATALIGTLIAALFLLGAHRRLRRIQGPAIEEARRWTCRLDAAMVELTSRGRMPEGEHSVVELVAESHKLLQTWLDQSGGTWGYLSPVYWLSAWASSAGAIVAFAFGIDQIDDSPYASVLAFLVFGLSASCAFLILRRWKRDTERDRAETLTSWDARMMALESKMGEYISER